MSSFKNQLDFLQSSVFLKVGIEFIGLQINEKIEIVFTYSIEQQ